MGNIGILSAIAMRTEHTDPSVRAAALRALIGLSPQGHPPSLQAITRCLEDADSSVRELALEGVAQVSEHGDENTVQCTARLLSDRNPRVREVAADTLRMVANVGDPFAKRSLEESDGLAHKSLFVRMATIKALEALSEDKSFAI